jgi:hypothetical protein
MMRKYWAIGGVIVAAGLVSWNEYRVWTTHNHPQPLPLLPSNSDSSASLPAVMEYGVDIKVDQQKGTDRSTGEEECDVTIIDLTKLQQQTSEPPLADTLEPPIASAKCTSKCDFRTVPYALPCVPQFLPFSADPNGSCAASVTLTTKSAAIDTTPEELRVMPRLIDFYPEPAPVELNVAPRPANPKSWWERFGTWTVDGIPNDPSQYHRSLPDSSSGDEQQDKPPTAPKNIDAPKRTKLDTMEIRPGDLPQGTIRKPF